MCKPDTIETVYFNAFVPLPTWLSLVLRDEYAEPSILGDKRSLIYIIIALSKRKDGTNSRTKRTKSQQDIYLFKQFKYLQEKVA